MSDAVVRLRGVPVRSWLRLQEHTDALMREYRLIMQQGAEQMPAELLRLFATLQADFPQSAVPGLRGAVKAAFDAGHTTADVDTPVTFRQAELMGALHETLVRIDAYCRDGVLLTLPLDDAISALRGWVVDEVARQMRGDDPRPYPGPLAE